MNNNWQPELSFNHLNSMKNFQKNVDALSESNRIKNQREVENNESLKQLVEFNEKICNYNKDLVSFNEKILNKLNSLDDTLEFLNNAFIDKSEMDKEQLRQHNALLVELIVFLEEKDEAGLKAFMNKIGIPVGVGLLVEYGKMKLGWSK